MTCQESVGVFLFMVGHSCVLYKKNIALSNCYYRGYVHNSITFIARKQSKLESAGLCLMSLLVLSVVDFRISMRPLSSCRTVGKRPLICKSFQSSNACVRQLH